MSETHAHISKTEFVTSLFDVSMSDFDHSPAGVTYSKPTGLSFAVYVLYIWLYMKEKIRRRTGFSQSGECAC
jgi:hypothetical protein